MANIIKCTFVLSGRDFDPELCSRELEIAPTSIWRQRHEHLQHRVDLPNVEWRYTVEDEATHESIDQALAPLTERLCPFAEKIRKLTETIGLSASVVCRIVVYETPAPAEFLSSASIAALAHLGVEFSWSISDRTE